MLIGPYPSCLITLSRTDFEQEKFVCFFVLYCLVMLGVFIFSAQNWNKLCSNGKWGVFWFFLVNTVLILVNQL